MGWRGFQGALAIHVRTGSVSKAPFRSQRRKIVIPAKAQCWLDGMIEIRY